MAAAQRDESLWSDTRHGAVSMSAAGMRQLLRHPRRSFQLLAHLEHDDGIRFSRTLKGARGQRFVRTVAAYLLTDDVESVVAIRNGVRWRTAVSDDIGWSVYATGGFEADAVTALLRWLAESSQVGAIIDLGANIGTTTVPFALAGYRVVAVEPIPATFAMLQENVTANGLADDVRCVQAAVEERGPELEMVVRRSGGSEVLPDYAAADPAHDSTVGSCVRVPVKGLDEIIQEHELTPQDVALVWADVQGSESAVIRTGVGLWAHGVPLYLEVEPGLLAGHGGVDHFVALAERHFTSFIPRETLVGSDNPRAFPIGCFAEWVQSIRIGEHRDALLTSD